MPVLLPASIITRLYVYGGVALAVVLLMSGMALHFVRESARAAHHIHGAGLVGIVDAGDIELLLERHRRIVEAAPVQLDRHKVDEDRRHSEEIADAIEERIREQHEDIPVSIGELLPRLVEQGRRVLYLAANYAQAKALDAVLEYADTAALIQYEIRNWRADRISVANQEVAQILTRGGKLKRGIVFSVLLAVLLMGPLTFVVVSGIGSRIRTMTGTMLQLARNDTTVAVTATADPDEIGDMARALAVFKDNAIALNAERDKVEQLNAWFDIALNNMARGLSMLDADQRLLVCNRRFRDIYALPEELCRPGTPIERILEHHFLGRRDKSGSEARADMARWLERYLALVRSGEPFNLSLRTASGRTVLVAYQPLQEGGCVAVHEDVTEKRIADRQIARLARVDTLTEVANRHAFRETLTARLEAMRPDEGLALLWIDLDRFKEVNDTLGHPVGDALLKAFAGRVRECVRSGDLVARLGGDEFAVLQQGCNRAQDAERLAHRLLEVASLPYLVCGQRIEIGASIGVALAPAHGADPDELLKSADIALYRAKTEGRGRLVVFRNELAETLRERRELELALKSALANGELELHYQPIVDLGSGRVTSCEALMRWRHSRRGMIPPGLFIPIAEDIGLIGELGEWALERACRDALVWPDAIKVAVNLSVAQFASKRLDEVVRRVLRMTGLAADRLVLEVTETLLLKDDARTLEVLNAIDEMGVSIALDDFGTGYASLSYLRSFPFDKLKIDQTFVRDIELREDSVAIVRAITTLARSLGMRTVAEGVETVDHLEKVAGAGCDEAQGYLFSRPVPAGDIAGVIEACGRAVSRAA